MLHFDSRPVCSLFAVVLCAALVPLAGCSVFLGEKAKRAELEADILALGGPIVDVETRFQLRGLSRQLDVDVTVDSREVSGELLQSVVTVLDEHSDIDYVSGTLMFVTERGGFISIRAVGKEIGLPEYSLDSGVFRFTKNRVYDFIQQS